MEETGDDIPQSLASGSKESEQMTSADSGLPVSSLSETPVEESSEGTEETDDTSLEPHLVGNDEDEIQARTPDQLIMHSPPPPEIRVSSPLSQGEGQAQNDDQSGSESQGEQLSEGEGQMKSPVQIEEKEEIKSVTDGNEIIESKGEGQTDHEGQGDEEQEIAEWLKEEETNIESENEEEKENRGGSESLETKTTDAKDEDDYDQNDDDDKDQTKGKSIIEDIIEEIDEEDLSSNQDAGSKGDEFEDENIGSVSDEEQNIANDSLNSFDDDQSGSTNYLDLSPHIPSLSRQIVSNSSFGETDDLLQGFKDDGASSVVSDIFTDISTNPQSIPPATPKYTKPLKHSYPLSRVDKFQPKPLFSSSLPMKGYGSSEVKGQPMRSLHVTNTPAGYYLDFEEAKVGNLPFSIK